jgi:hypothetical protein
MSVLSHELKLRALAAALLCVGAALLVAPASALAGTPKVIGGEGLVQSTGKTTALTEAAVFPEGEVTKYHVAWSLAASPWCTSQGVGTPEHETTPIEISANTSFAVERVELTGLQNGQEYCVEAIATNVSGPAQSEQATFTAGAPSVVFFAESTGTAMAFTAYGLVDPAGQATHYWMEYEVASSRWCTTAGKEGSSHSSAHFEAPLASEYTEVAVDLTGLSSGTQYCGRLVAENESGEARSAVAPFATESILTVAVGGSGSGTVRTNTTKISCPGTCSATYTYGSTATLNAEPAAGSTFAGWSGACSGTALKCNFSMSGDQTVTATFIAKPPAAPLPAPLPAAPPPTPPPKPPPTNPPVLEGKPLVNLKTGEIQVEYQFPEPGQAETFGEVTQGATLASVHTRLGSAGESKRTKRCPRGYVKSGKRCVNNAPVRYGQSVLTVSAPGTSKIDVKPSGKVLAALRKGRTLAIRVTLIFTPAETTDHITEVSTTTVHLKLKSHSGKHRR